MSWRVVLTGSECTGKTTLARVLAALLGAPCVDEASRAYAAARGGALTAADVEPIARATINSQRQVRGEGAGVIVHDTDLVSTVVYARAYYGECPAWIEAECRKRLADLYLLCSPDLPWVADGVRDRPAAEERAAMHEAFVDALKAMGARVAIVEGVGAARMALAREAVLAALPAGARPQSTTAVPARAHSE